MIAPEPPLQHATITLPIKEEKKATSSAASLAHTNFDSLLGRSNYMSEPPAQQLSPGQVVSLAQPSLPPLRHSVTSSAPPAHQSPKHTSTPNRGTTRPPEQQQYMIISSPKKASVSQAHKHSKQRNYEASRATAVHDNFQPKEGKVLPWWRRRRRRRSFSAATATNICCTTSCLHSQKPAGDQRPVEQSRRGEV